MELQSVSLLHCLLSLCLGFMLLHFCECGPLNQNLLYCLFSSSITVLLSSGHNVDGWFLCATTSTNSAHAFSSQNRSSFLASLHTCLPRAGVSLWRKQKQDLTVLSSNSWKVSLSNQHRLPDNKETRQNKQRWLQALISRCLVDTSVKYSALLSLK